jgi:hypothetical protein
VDPICPGVVDADAEIRLIVDFAELVADEVDDRLEVQLCGDALLNAVDERELARALLELAVRFATFCSSFSAKRALSSATAACAASMPTKSRSVSWKRPNAPSMSA